MGRENASKVDEWLTEEGLLLLEAWARDFTLGDICVKAGISTTTLAIWRQKYPEIEEALRKGKEVVDYLVENALLKRALGFKTTEVKTILNGQPDKDGNRQVRVEKIEKEVAPDTTACLAWLNNRKPDEWKKNRDNLFELKDDERNITINVVTSDKKDKLKTVVKDGVKKAPEEDWDE